MRVIIEMTVEHPLDRANQRSFSEVADMVQAIAQEKGVTPSSARLPAEKIDLIAISIC